MKEDALLTWGEQYRTLMIFSVFMPPPGSGGGHIVSPSVICPYVHFSVHASVCHIS